MSCFVNSHGYIILKLVELKGRYGGGGVGGKIGGEGKIGLFLAGEGVMVWLRSGVVRGFLKGSILCMVCGLKGGRM